MNEIIGISAGRNNKISEKAVKSVLNETNLSTKFYSLSEFEILTCDACNGCIETHRCVKNDKLNEIIEEMDKAKGIVFAAPEYWDGMNAKGRAFWERVCYSTRHNNNFPFKELKGIIIGVSGDGDSTGVINDIRKFYKDARIETISEVEVQGEYGCFTCGYGGVCQVGGLTNLYNLPKSINEEDIPDLCRQHPEKYNNGKNILSELKKAAKAFNDD